MLSSIEIHVYRFFQSNTTRRAFVDIENFMVNLNQARPGQIGQQNDSWRTLIAQGNDKWAAVGHPAAYSIDGKDYPVFHVYAKKDGGKPKLMIREIKWDGDAWPTI